jgi:hypothetical protein
VSEPRPSRRRLLKVGIASAALLGAGGGLLSWLGRGYRLLPGEAAIGLSVKELCVARAAVEALLPGGDGLPSGVELGIHQRMDEAAWAADEPTRGDLRAALQLVEHAPVLVGRFGKLSALAPAERLAALEAMTRHSIDLVTQAALAVRQLAFMLYYSRDETWEAIGYEGPWIAEARPPESSLRYRELLAERGAAA